MFSLIITIISIALVAALALATLYYGGSAFERGAASADATKLHVQAQQLQGAAELYKADTGAYPLTMEAMLTGNYLKSIPVSSLNPGLNPAQETGNSPALMAQASAAGVVWKMVLSGYPVFAMTQVSAAVCEAVNMKAYGISGILKSARAGYATQCFGPDLANLTMVTTKSGAALITASLSPLATVSLGTVLSTVPPAVNSGDMTDAGWLTVGGLVVAAVPPAPTGPTPDPVTGLLPTGSQGTVLYRTARVVSAPSDNTAYDFTPPVAPACDYSLGTPSPSCGYYDYGDVLGGSNPINVKVWTSNNFNLVDTPYYDDVALPLIARAVPAPTLNERIYYGPGIDVALESMLVFPVNGQDIVYVGIDKLYRAHDYQRYDFFEQYDSAVRIAIPVTAVSLAAFPNKSNELTTTTVCWSANPGDTSVKQPEVCPTGEPYNGFSQGNTAPNY